jgi:hypothetical protein
MFIPISIDNFIKEHLENFPGENEKVLRLRLEEALLNYQKGIKCTCGNDIWIIGAVTAWNSCFSCNTGKKHRAGDYDIDSAIEKRDKYGRRHIDKMEKLAKAEEIQMFCLPVIMGPTRRDVDLEKGKGENG